MPDSEGACPGATCGDLLQSGDGPPQITLPGGDVVAPGGFLHLDGTISDYVDFGKSDTLSPDHLSVAFWFRAPGDPDDPGYQSLDYSNRVILSKHGGGTLPSSWEFGFSSDAGDAARLQFVSWGGSNKVYTRSNRFTAADFKDGQCHHVVGTCDGSAARLYVDGCLLETSTQTNAIKKSSDYSLIMGRRSFDSVPEDAWSFPGDVGGPLLIYDHALGEAEVAAMFGCEPTPPAQELLASWNPGDDTDLGNSATLNAKQITVVVWAKADGDHSGEVLVAKQGDAKGAFELGIDEPWGGRTHGELYFKVHVGSSKVESADSSYVMAGSTIYGTFDAFDAADFDDGNWHMFVGTHDGEYTSLYVDGQLVDSPLNRGFVNDTDEDVNLLVGENSDSGGGDPFSGLLGGPLLLYNYAMTADAIIDMYQNRPILPGDANLDGDVDETDAAIMLSHWQQFSSAGWADGDFNGDGHVDDADATILASNWQKSAAMQHALPEPAAAAMLAVLGIAATVFRKCRRNRRFS